MKLTNYDRPVRGTAYHNGGPPVQQSTKATYRLWLRDSRGRRYLAFYNNEPDRAIYASPLSAPNDGFRVMM